MKIVFSRIILFGCALVCFTASAQTGVTVIGDVYIAPNAQVAIHADELVLQADVQGEGEVIMAAKTRQRIHAKGHRVNRLMVSNPAGVDVVSDLVVAVALNIPVGEFRLVDARLIVPNDDVINAQDHHKIHLIGQSMVLVKSHETPTTRTGATHHPITRVSTAVIPEHFDWSGITAVNRLARPTTRLVSTLSVMSGIPSPPPRSQFIYF